jgi:precorrin-2 dehydrogenase/sirohydrochlorin ferrochelatase
VRYHPVYLDLRGRRCVVVGGGDVAQGKVESLLEAGARVTVVSPVLTAALAALADTHEILHHPRPYRRGDLSDAVLAYVAVDDEHEQEEVAGDAAAAGVFLNVVDMPRLCTFIAPAVVRREPVAIAISTGGASPALARRLREELEVRIGPEYGVAATILARLRPLVCAAEPDPQARARTFARLVDGPLLDALRARDSAGVDAILRDAAGEGATLGALGVALH